MRFTFRRSRWLLRRGDDEETDRPFERPSTGLKISASSGVAVVEGTWSLRNMPEGTVSGCDRTPGASVETSKRSECGVVASFLRASVVREIPSATTPSRDEARSRWDLAGRARRKALRERTATDHGAP